MKKICWEEKVIWVEKEIWDSKGVWESKRNTKVFFYVFNFTRFYQFSAFLPAPCGSSLLWPCLLLSHNSSSLKRFQPFPTSLSTRVFSKCLFLFFFLLLLERLMDVERGLYVLCGWRKWLFLFLVLVLVFWVIDWLLMSLLKENHWCE